MPAISFDSDPIALDHSEMNQLIETFVARNSANYNAMSYKQNWKQYDYLTPNNDTIKYWFIRDNVFNVIVTIPNIELKELKSLIEKQLKATPLEDDFYETPNYFLRAYKNLSDNNCYVVYFYPEESIKEVYKEIFNPQELTENQKLHYRASLDSINGFQLAIQFYLGMYGRVTGMGMLYGKVPDGHYGKLVFDAEEIKNQQQRFLSIFEE